MRCVNKTRNAGIRLMLVGVMAAVACTMCQGAEPLTAVVDRLAGEHLFAMGGIGIAGKTSDGEKDFRVILSAPAGEASMERLFRIGSPEAKVYALLGMHQLDPKRFAVLAASLHASTRRVATMQGCLMGHQVMADLVRRIEAGEYLH